MSEAWIDVSHGGAKTRHPLGAGLVRLGGAGCDVVVAESGGDELHVWSDPAKAIHVGGATTPLLNGRVFDEAPLQSGDTIQWGGTLVVFGREERPVLEELPEAAVATAATSAATASVAGVAWQRLHAGLLVELGLADRKAAKRWQEAVLAGEFDADACARDILSASAVPADDPRLVERAARLERDLLMMPFQRGIKGTSRRVRGAARGGAAFVVANVIAILVYTLILAAIVLLLRVRHDFSIDGMIDRWLGVFG